MPDLTSQASLLRAGNYRFTGYIGAIAQTVVFSRAVNMATITYPVTAITYDDAYTGAGAYTDVREDMTVLVYDGNTSALKGTLRVAAGGASSTVLQVNEFSRGTLDLADNDRFDVVSEWRIHDKLVEAAAALRKDSRITFADQTDDYPPVANGGGAVFAMCDAGQTYATVSFDFTASFAVDPDNTGGLTYATDVKDGTITVGADTDSSFTATFPYGTRWIELTVTDADNSASSVKQIPVDIYHPTLRPPLAVQMETLSCGNAGQDGWSMTFRLPKGAEAALASLPDGAMIGYFEDEWYGTTNASYGGNEDADRSAQKFVGYLVRDSISITPDESEVTFEAVSPLAILEQTAALTQLMIRDQSPDDWQDVKTLTVNRALWYLWYWHSSVAAAFDFLWVDGSDLAYSRLAVEDTSSMAAQLRDIASAIHVQLTADHLGRLLFVRDPHYLSVSDRSSRTTTYNLTTADILEAGIDREHRRTVKFVRGEAITPGTSASDQLPVFSNAPGNAPGEGTAVETLSRKIATQTEINRLTGEHYARVNGLYYNETTKAHTLVPKGARLALPDGYAVFDPAYREFVTLALASSTNPRGVAFTTATKWTVEDVTITYNAELGTKEIEVTLDHETHGVPGVNYVPPQTSDVNLPSLPSLDLTLPGYGLLPLPGAGSLLDFNVNRLGIVKSDGTINLTATFNAQAGGVTWGTDAAIASLSGTPLEFEQRAGTSPVAGWILTSTDIEYCADLANASPSATSQLTFGTASSYRSMSSDYASALAGLFAFVSSYYTGTGIKTTRTTDGGTTWGSEVTVTSFYDTAATAFKPGAHVVSQEAGKAYTSAYTQTGADGQGSLYESTDSAASWAELGGLGVAEPDEGLAGGIYAPYEGNPGGDVVFFGRTNSSGAGTIGRFFDSYDGAADDSDLLGDAYGPSATRSHWTIHSPNDNGDIVYVAVENRARNSWGVVRYVRSTDTATWIVSPDASVPYRRVAALDNCNGRYAILFGVNGAIALYDALAGTVTDRTSNLSTSAEIIGVFGY